MLEEAVVTCPACWEQIVLELDLSGGSAVYAEDCPVCCRPMTVRLTVGEDGGFEVQVEAEEG
ncbi:CPXCG motif-containing cysteine-rich protein [Solimonas fluminis]|uniref:CPXCG motif-containing cysteine-rich protein n=1 Tax=Solimonas fluminis TaxID=2086571 RepID=A0A2S5TJ24_9GAMM|nr:CPXCG motif-containing cysteine-rich protein [Solimonas fluminis]PPE74965.1 CPXCG motif-containing cysteine-rich protein [Solimonas fluminis]